MHNNRELCSENLIFLFKVMQYKVRYQWYILDGIEDDSSFNIKYGYRILLPKQVFKLAKPLQSRKETDKYIAKQLIESEQAKQKKKKQKGRKKKLKLKSQKRDSNFQIMKQPSVRKREKQMREKRDPSNRFGRLTKSDEISANVIAPQTSIPNANHNNNNKNNGKSSNSGSKEQTGKITNNSNKNSKNNTKKADNNNKNENDNNSNRKEQTKSKHGANSDSLQIKIDAPNDLATRAISGISNATEVSEISNNQNEMETPKKTLTNRYFGQYSNH